MGCLSVPTCVMVLTDVLKGLRHHTGRSDVRCHHVTTPKWTCLPEGTAAAMVRGENPPTWRWGDFSCCPFKV